MKQLSAKKLILYVVGFATVGAIGALMGAISGALAAVALAALFSVSITFVATSGVGAALGAIAATIWIVNVAYTHRGVAI